MGSAEYDTEKILIADVCSAGGFMYNDEVQKTLRKLQLAELNIIKLFMKICEKEHLRYFMIGGTMLGAIRHKGFIPWDDDVDIMMLRNEYNKFKAVFDEELSEKYVLAEPLSSPRYFSKMVKVFKKDTTYVEIPTAGADGPNMIFVDLFLLENVPNPGIKRKIIAIAYNTAFRAASVCLDYKYPSLPILEKSKTDRELRNYYNFRRSMGFFFSLFGSIQSYIKISSYL